jgi:hypothetical protein
LLDIFGFETFEVNRLNSFVLITWLKCYSSSAIVTCLSSNSKNMNVKASCGKFIAFPDVQDVLDLIDWYSSRCDKHPSFNATLAQLTFTTYSWLNVILICSFAVGAWRRIRSNFIFIGVSKIFLSPGLMLTVGTIPILYIFVAILPGIGSYIQYCQCTTTYWYVVCSGA